VGRPRLFVEDCSDHSERKPHNFGFLTRPALEAFNAVVHTLDKVLSENVNRDFFGNEIAIEIETVRSANHATTSPASGGMKPTVFKGAKPWLCPRHNGL
jgi:hypothetical protein